MPREGRPRRPSAEAICTAADWLRSNEGAGGEAEACRLVADWLEADQARRDDEAIMRKAHSATGLPRSKLRPFLGRLRPLIGQPAEG